MTDLVIGNLSHNKAEVFRDIVRNAHFLVAITGAGISVASGLPLLRDTVHELPLREFFTKRLWSSDPIRYFDVYREIWQRFRLAAPNPAHRVLAGSRVAVITQNIDGLHRDAGTERLLELHGNLRELRCAFCGYIGSSERSLRDRLPRCPVCRHVLRPGITLEGEPIRHFARAVDWVGEAEVLLVVGTSLQMEPVCRLPDLMLRRGRHVIRVNRRAEYWLPWLLSHGEQ